jgi:NhaA family Na+:H+ antiporter
VYRHFVVHDGTARLVAQASEAAGLQHKFWDMHRRLYDRDARFDEQSLIGYAAALELDVEQFKKDLHSDAVRSRVERDYDDAVQSGARETPTLFIDGRAYRGAWDELSITEAIEKPVGVRLRIAAYDFINWAASVGFALIVATLAALLFVNLGFSETYQHLVHTPVSIGFDTRVFALSLEGWINDGLMALFFLLVGIEIKRELLSGELSTARKAALPVVAAIGGMVVPALLYALLNWNAPTRNGWGIPMATDIAFTLGLMALLGKRVPPSLKVFVSALAVADDLGAIIIIALFYSSTLHYQAFLYAGLILALLLGLNRGRIYSRTPYFILGIFLWYFVHESGLHATLAGILLAAIIPARKEANVEDIAAQASAILRHELQRNRKSSSQKISTVSLANLVGALERLRDPGAHVESGLQHWSNYVILPLFAFFNTGILLVGLPYAIAEKQNLGVMLGLAAGKPIGIFLLSYLSVKTGLVRLSNELRWLHILGAGCLAGVGFTMSIFIANAAFEGNTLNSVKLSILIASVSAALLGMALLYAASEKRRNVKGKRQCVEAA